MSDIASPSPLGGPATVSFTLVREAPADAEALGVGVFSDRLEDEGTGVDWAFLPQQGFEAKVGQTLTVPGDGGSAQVVVGLGEEGALDLDAVRRAGAGLARASRRYEHLAVTVLGALPESLGAAEAAQALAEGIALGAYRFDRYRSDPPPNRLATVSVVGGGGKRTQAALDRGARVAAAVGLARDLVNEPGGALTPRALAEVATPMAEREGLRIDVLDEVDIEPAGLRGLLGVNRGSTEPPRFIEIAHEPERPQGFVALVGKGITFDSGGLPLKSTEGMVGMKGDMGGAAAVLGAMSAVAGVAPRLKVVGYIPATDNMPGPDATRVGDVLRIRNHKTVEVLNTDAEGRLVLADALSLAAEAEPDAVVDLATLTGACIVALGPRIAGLMGNHDAWCDQVRAAAGAAGEPVWPLPLPDDLRPGLESAIADLRNIGTSRYGGSLTAGLFLSEFVPDGLPWAHLDIAGPAHADEEHGENPKGGTGFGVRTLLRLLADYRKPR